MVRWLLRRLSSFVRAASAVLLAGACAAASAQSIESVLRPGDVVQSHAKVEEDCAKCHVRFDRAGQDRLCTDCHQDVGRDMRERTGFHGRQRPQACRSCHTDHKGRGAQIVVIDKARFDHAQTDWPLQGRHAPVACTKCHEPKKKWSAAPTDCAACHRADDPHRGRLGPACADCHTVQGWKRASFDHSKTRFALGGRHADAGCSACHAQGAAYDAAPRECIGCHRKDDAGAKGHKGQFGEKCESCHGSKAWKPSTFNHDTDTKFDLVGKHKGARCASCHTGPLWREKPGRACIDCHRKDDEGARGHRGSVGSDCAACHVERGWKEKGRFDHQRTRFPLQARHAEIGCGDCHRTPRYQEAPRECVACHRKDDESARGHQGTLGTRCESCHGERVWKTPIRFDHDGTRFKLRNAHAAPALGCRSCHADARHYKDTALACASCHRKDDRHEGQLGARCESCHGDRDWRVPSFDHRHARFALVGRHLGVACKDCHPSPRFRDAARDCVSCHRKDDTHREAFGTACESCHNARAWPLADHDHARRARFALDGRHARLACAACHTQPAPAGKAAADLGRSCRSCHAKDDVHDGAFGPQCEQCHASDGWKRVRARTASAPRSTP